MIDRTAAEVIAREHVQRASKESGHDFVLMDDRTIEFDLGWVFFYSTREHVETGDVRKAVPGNAPILIGKADGQVHPTGTAQAAQYYIDKFREGHGR